MTIIFRWTRFVMLIGTYFTSFLWRNSVSKASSLKEGRFKVSDSWCVCDFYRNTHSHTPVNVFRQVFESVVADVQTLQAFHAKDADRDCGKLIFCDVQVLQFFEITQLKKETYHNITFSFKIEFARTIYVCLLKDRVVPQKEAQTGFCLPSSLIVLDSHIPRVQLECSSVYYNSRLIPSGWSAFLWKTRCLHLISNNDRGTITGVFQSEIWGLATRTDFHGKLRQSVFRDVQHTQIHEGLDVRGNLADLCSVDVPFLEIRHKLKIFR